MKKVVIEFIGISRILTGISRYEIETETALSYQDIVALLAEKFPQLINQMIDPKTRMLYPSNLFSRNGTQMLRPEDMHQKANDGDRLILMSILAGGSNHSR